MTYQKTSPNNDNAVEESSLLTIVTASPDPSLSFGQEGGDVPATKKKNGGVPMRLMIATTCILLGTLAVLYVGSGSSSTASSGGLAADLLRSQNQAPELYAPGGYDKCYRDKDNPGKYCWHDSRFMGGCGSCWPFPMEQWEIDPNPHGNNNCGQLCDQFAPANVGW